MKITYQVIKTGLDLWEVQAVSEPAKNSFQYELLGRILGEGGLFFIEVPEWKNEGYIWFRCPGRGHLLVKGALAELIHRKGRMS